MKPTQLLSDEHKVIKRAIKVLDAVDRRLQSGDQTVVTIYPKLIDFIRRFADQYHHGKEEDILFRFMERRGMDREMSPIGMMVIEHEYGREFVRDLEAAVDRLRAGDAGARPAVLSSAKKYRDLLTSHIDKEDHILYPMADKMLTEADQEKLESLFARTDAALGPELRTDYERLVGELEVHLFTAGATQDSQPERHP